VGYGGLELICSALIDALVRRGHHVTLFGAGERHGTLATKFVSTTAELQYPRIGELVPAVLHTARVNRMLAAGDFDVIHDHTIEGLITGPARPAPTVVTVHLTVDGEHGDLLEAAGNSARLVSISHNQRACRPGLAWAGTVYNGLPLDQVGPVSPGAAGDGPVLWLARFNPDKGPDIAIEACRAAGLPLLLVGKCNEANEHETLRDMVRPMLGPDVELVVNAHRPVVDNLIQQARCLLLPIRWAEPFGMVMIEAMAKGLPVVALRQGSVPELIEHGVTGFICDRPEDLPAALHRVKDLDPQACVEHVRRHFGADLMARRYEEVYLDAMAHSRSARLGRPLTQLVPTNGSRPTNSRPMDHHEHPRNNRAVSPNNAHLQRP
jgi:glycosyltransferase involved in cell wall biosynthesis